MAHAADDKKPAADDKKPAAGDATVKPGAGDLKNSDWVTFNRNPTLLPRDYNGFGMQVRIRYGAAVAAFDLSQPAVDAANADFEGDEIVGTPAAEPPATVSAPPGR